VAEQMHLFVSPMYHYPVDGLSQLKACGDWGAWMGGSSSMQYPSALAK